MWARRSWISEEREKLVQRFENEGPELLSQEMSRSEHSVTSEAARLGLRTKARLENKLDRLSKQKENLDVLYFDRDWTPNQVYLGGYIFADGTIGRIPSGFSRVRFQASDPDGDLIYTIRDELKSTHRVSRGRGKSGEKEFTRLSITNSYFTRSLCVKFGLDTNKSNLNLPYPNFPEELGGHFARGILDGDGDVGSTQSRLRFSGSPDFLQTFREKLIKKLCVSSRKLENQGKICRVRWSKREDLIILRNFLYPPGSYIFGERKRNLLERWCVGN